VVASAALFFSNLSSVSPLLIINSLRYDYDQLVLAVVKYWQRK